MLRLSASLLAVTLGACAPQPPVSTQANPRPTASAAPVEPPRPTPGRETRVDRLLAELDVPKGRERAIERLALLFEETLRHASNDRTALAVQAMVNSTNEKLTHLYVDHYGELGVGERVRLIQLLEAQRDPRAEPAFRKTFEEFTKNPGVRPEQEDIIWAARATQTLKLDSLADPLLQAFLVLRVRTELGAKARRPLKSAMLEIKSPSWVGPLLQKLAAPLNLPKEPTELEVSEYGDQDFWQSTAIQLLGEIRDPAAIAPLFNVMLDEAKSEMIPYALGSLVMLGKPTADAALRLLRERKSDVHARTAAFVLGACGRSDSTPHLIAALKTEKKPEMRAILARALTELPASAASKLAFRTAFEATPPGTRMPPLGTFALDALIDDVVQFYDPSFVDWLLERMTKTRGSAQDLMVFRLTALEAALRLAQPTHLAPIRKFVGPRSPFRQEYEQAEGVLQACGSEATCYLEAARKPENQSDDTRFVAVKALYMLGTLGTEHTRDEILKHYGDFTNPGVSYAATTIVDHLTPQGSPEVARRLREVIAGLDPSNEMYGVEIGRLQRVLYRIECRGQ